MSTEPIANASLNDEQLLQALRALLQGDLSVRMPEGDAGTAGEIATVVNELNDFLGVFRAEITRIAREVGTEGRFGGQAEVEAVGDSGIWKDITDNINIMASNLTAQTRDVALVVTSIANGDLTSKIGGNTQGEVLELATTLNVMSDQLSLFASEVTRIAREIGTEGRFGGQAEVRGVSGTWKDLTDNINHMGANLTNQLRDMNNVTRAAVNGDLSQRVTVGAEGETLELKNNINVLLDKLHK